MLVPGMRRGRDRPDAIHEGDDQPFVELRATRVLEAGQRLVDGQGLAVRPGRRHRGERIAHRQDPGDLRDVVAGQAVQVALPIPALVVVADAGADLLEVGQLADDEIAERDMLLHDLVLGLGERAGLAEDVVGDADLADVVEATGAVDHRASPLVETELGAEERGVAGDILGMPARVVVLRIDRDDQPFQDVEADRLLERHRLGLSDPDAVAAAGPGLVERPCRAR